MLARGKLKMKLEKIKIERSPRTREQFATDYHLCSKGEFSSSI